VAKKDISEETILSEKEFDRLVQRENAIVRSKRSALSHDKIVLDSSNIVLDTNFEWLNRYFKEIQEVKRTILSKSNVVNPASFEEWVQDATDYWITYQNKNPGLVLCHEAGCSNLDTADLSGKPEDEILLEFSQGDTRSKYLSQGLLRIFGPDFIKRLDVSEWPNKITCLTLNSLLPTNIYFKPETFLFVSVISYLSIPYSKNDVLKNKFAEIC
jgi:hypothetical protein